MPGKMILHFNHGQTREAEYTCPQHAVRIVRRWTLNFNLISKQHYITIRPDYEDDEQNVDPQTACRDWLPVCME